MLQAFQYAACKSGYVAPSLVNGVTVAAEQSESVKNAITFSFVGLETFTGIILVVLLIFLNVEKGIEKSRQKSRKEKV